MDAVKFIQERNRMCAIYTPKNCKGCPADSYGGEGVACIMIDKIDADRLVPIVEKWSKENSRKTRQSEFLHQWPNTKLDCHGVLVIDPCDLDKTMQGKDEDCYYARCDKCRRDFWMQGVE